MVSKILAPFHTSVLATETLIATPNNFYLKWNFPTCVGNTDGKHTRMKSP
jgi:hypothetical protein